MSVFAFEDPRTRRRCSITLEEDFDKSSITPWGPPLPISEAFHSWRAGQWSPTKLSHPPSSLLPSAPYFFSATLRSNDSAVMSSSNRHCEFDSSDQFARDDEIKRASPDGLLYILNRAFLQPQIYPNFNSEIYFVSRIYVYLLQIFQPRRNCVRWNLSRIRCRVDAIFPPVYR